MTMLQTEQNLHFMAKTQSVGRTISTDLLLPTRITLLIAVPILAAVATLAHQIIDLLVGPAWSDIAGILPAWCAIGLFVVIGATQGLLMAGLGQWRLWLSFLLAQQLMAAFYILLFRNFELAELSTAIAVQALIMWVPSVHIVSRALGIKNFRYLSVFLAPLGATSIAVVSTMTLRSYLPSFEAPVDTGFAIGAGFVIYLLAIWVLDYREILAAISAMRKPKTTSPSSAAGRGLPKTNAEQTIALTNSASYGSTALRGGLVTALSQGVQMLCQFASVIVLSRLLEPGDFGLVALTAPVIGLLNIFKELGLLQAVIQKKDLTYGQLNALFWINISVSVALGVLLWTISPAIAAFYNAPDVVPLLHALAVTMVISGLGAQHFALLNRNMRFGLLAINSAIGAVITLIVAIVWALVHPSAWALVGGSLVGVLVSTALTWIWEPWRPGVPKRARGVSSLLGFGVGLSGFTLSNFFARNLDNVLIGRVWGTAPLGLYDRAYKLLLMPLSQVADPLSRVMIPVLSRLQDEPERYAAAFFRVFGLMQLLLLPLVATLTAMAGTAVPFLLGEQWAGAAPIFAALGIAGLVQPLANPTGWLFISQGRTKTMAAWGLCSASVMSAVFVVSVSYGVETLAQAYAGTSVLTLVPLWFVLTRRGPITSTKALRHLAPAFAGGFAALLTVYLSSHMTPFNGLMDLVLGGFVSYVTFACVISTTNSGRATLSEAKALATKAASMAFRTFIVRRQHSSLSTGL